MFNCIKEKILLICFVFLPFSGFNQIYYSKPDALKSIDEGKALLEKGDTEKAIEKFNFAMNHGAEISALHLKAKAYLKLNDTCNFCKNLKLLEQLKDHDTFKLYKTICFSFDTIRSNDISLYIEYPKYYYTLIEVSECLDDSIVSYRDANDEIIESTINVSAKRRGGWKAIYRFLVNNINYPQEALSQGIQGTTLIKFNINKEGNLDNFVIIKQIGGGCEEELIKILKKIPKIRPATKGGIPIDTSIIFPFVWKIND